jgi:hypothetical protein
MCCDQQRDGGRRPAAATHESPTKERDATMNLKSRDPGIKVIRDSSSV